MPTSPPESQMPEPLIIRGVNFVGLWTLIQKECSRFLKVYTQTIIAPMITTLLFYTVFALAFGGVTRQIGEVPFLSFLAPGLIMMTMVQNAFANSSSSILISKIQGNIVDMLMPPLSSEELLLGYIIGSVLRGLSVGVVSCVVVNFFVPLQFSSFPIILAFAFLGTMMLGTLGLAGGIWSEKFDHLAAFTNFIITPLTFLSGTFYSVNILPGMWKAIALYNPFFYMIDGFRSGFIGQADSNVLVGLVFLSVINVLLVLLVLWMLRSGYKMKS